MEKAKCLAGLEMPINTAQCLSIVSVCQSVSPSVTQPLGPADGPSSHLALVALSPLLFYSFQHDRDTILESSPQPPPICLLTCGSLSLSQSHSLRLRASTARRQANQMISQPPLSYCTFDLSDTYMLILIAHLVLFISAAAATNDFNL